MAEALFKAMVGKEDSLRSTVVELNSAGTDAMLDSATPEAIECMAKYGLNLNSHQPKSINSHLVQCAELVLVMESLHKEVVLSRFPNAAKKTHLLSEYMLGRAVVSPIRIFRALKYIKNARLRSNPC